MAAPIAGFTGMPNYGEVPLEVQFTDLSTGLPTSWLWTYGDGETGAIQNPTHTYTDVGNYTVTLAAINLDGTGTHTINDAISAYRTVSVVQAPGVTLVAPTLKYCGPFTCMGWVRSPTAGPSGNSLITLAISDSSGGVRGSASALYFELMPDSGDWRLEFSGSKSRLIRQTVGIDLSDDLWHMLAWVCDDSGVVTFYVDGLVVAAEYGLGPDGVAWYRPHTTSVRCGGGYVWVPCLDEAGQAMAIYNWRYASDLVIHAQWVRELMAVDRANLGV